MENRRKSERKYIKFFSKVFDRKSRRVIGYLVDLTTEGAMIVSENPLRDDGILHFKITLPENYDQEELNLVGRIIWSDQEIDSALFRNGVQLMDLSEAEIDLIGSLISDFGLTLEKSDAD